MKTEEKKAGHTPGPWQVNSHAVEQDTDQMGYVICYLETHDDRSESEQKANARRIVAAVNACESIPTEALERGVVGEMREALEMLEKQVKHIPGQCYVDHIGCVCGKGIARRLIRKAKGATHAE